MTTAQIPSRTTPGATYTVTLADDGAMSCSCPAGVYGKPCWHARAVRAEAAQHRVHAAGGWCAVERA